MKSRFSTQSIHIYTKQNINMSYRYDGNESDETLTDLIIYFPLLDIAVGILATW